MANVFCITYGGHAKNGKDYFPYKAIAHNAEEAIEVINSWKSYGRKNSTDPSDCIRVNETIVRKIRNLFRDGFGTYPSGSPITYVGFRTTGCGAWEIGFHPALADTIEEHERAYNEQVALEREEKARKQSEKRMRRMKALHENKRGWYHVEMLVTVYVFANHGNDFLTTLTVGWRGIADSGIDVYKKATKYIIDHPETLHYRGNMAVLHA